jgi:hypothetical protein
MGAMYQLVPVALETKLYSERLAAWPMIATLGCLIDGQVLTTTPGFHTSSFRPIAGLVWLFEFEGLSVVTHSPRAT